jgi:Na+-translocating ferredoxin:NAD+ oxidoreductase RNF subunit RnfB
MQTEFIIAIATLSGLGIISGVLLYLVAKQFRVEEDPRIEEVEKALPGANCGACGFAGCRNFAESCTKSEDISKLHCPVGGNATMKRVAQILGKTAMEKDPMVAVLRCNGCFSNRPRRNRFDAAQSCTIAHLHYQGETDCPYGCIGFGDCLKACKFDAIEIDPNTGLPVINEEKCTACGACVRACPRSLIEMRLKGPKGRRVYVR